MRMSDMSAGRLRPDLILDTCMRTPSCELESPWDVRRAVTFLDGEAKRGVSQRMRYAPSACAPDGLLCGGHSHRVALPVVGIDFSSR